MDPSELPAELFSLIFSYLLYGHYGNDELAFRILEYRLVSTRWRKLVSRLPLAINWQRTYTSSKEIEQLASLFPHLRSFGFVPEENGGHYATLSALGRLEHVILRETSGDRLWSRLPSSITHLDLRITASYQTSAEPSDKEKEHVIPCAAKLEKLSFDCGSCYHELPLSKLTNLTHLSLRCSCWVPDINPSICHQLSLLTKLVFLEAKIRPHHIKTLTRLQNLTLHGGLRDDEELAVLLNLRELKYFSGLTWNRDYSAEGLRLLGAHLTKLTCIDALYPILRVLEAFTNLANLDLDTVVHIAFRDATFTLLSRLEEVRVGSFGFCEENLTQTLEALRRSAKSLTDLSFSDARFCDDAHLPLIQNFRKLAYLDLHGVVSQTMIDCICGASRKTLRDISLRGLTSLTSLASIGRCRCLVSLRLNNTPSVGIEQLQHLTALEYLSRLWIGDNTPVDFAQLRGARFRAHMRDLRFCCKERRYTDDEISVISEFRNVHNLVLLKMEVLSDHQVEMLLRNVRYESVWLVPVSSMECSAMLVRLLVDERNPVRRSLSSLSLHYDFTNEDEDDSEVPQHIKKLALCLPMLTRFRIAIDAESDWMLTEEMRLQRPLLEISFVRNL